MATSTKSRLPAARTRARVRAAACVAAARSRPSSTAPRPIRRTSSSSTTRSGSPAQNEWFYSSILTLGIDGKNQKVLLRDMQRHPFKQQIMHLDFQRVGENEAIRFNVPLHFLNQEKSPAGKTAGVVVRTSSTRSSVSCLPKHLPEFIEVDLANLERGRHRPPVGPQAAGRRQDPGAEARQGARPRGRRSRAKPASRPRKRRRLPRPWPKCRRPRPPRPRLRPPPPGRAEEEVRRSRAGSRRADAHGGIAPDRRPRQPRGRTRQNPAQRRVLVY